MTRKSGAVVLAVLLAGCAPDAEPLQHPQAMPEANPVEYPPALWDQRLQGETLLMLHVDEGGGVDSAYVETSSGYPEFDSAAVAGGRRLRFTPGRRGDHTVAMWTQLRIRFTPDSTAALSVPVGPDSLP